jgi:Flp pilus assembly pilin Flp
MSWWDAQDGQGTVEYALILAFVAVVVVGTLVGIGPRLSSIFQAVQSAF